VALQAARAGTPDGASLLLDTRGEQCARRSNHVFIRSNSADPRLAWSRQCANLILAIASGLSVCVTSRAPSRIENPTGWWSRTGSTILRNSPGFRDREAEVFRDRSRTLEGLATYMWSTTVFQSARSHREITAAEVGPQFFNVTRSRPHHGTTSGRSGHVSCELRFLESELGGDRAAIGLRYESAAIPCGSRGDAAQFFILSAPVAVWIAASPEPPVPTRYWWLALRGAVACLRPDVTQEASEKELRQLLIDAHIARRNFSVRATPIADLVYRPAWSYGLDFLLSMSAILLWAVDQCLPRPPAPALPGPGRATSGASLY